MLTITGGINMTSKISAIDLRHHLGELLNRINLRDEQFIVERNGKPLAAIVPMWLFMKFYEEKMEFFKQVEEMKRKTSKVGSKVLDKVINEAMDFAKRRRI